MSLTVPLPSTTGQVQPERMQLCSRSRTSWRGSCGRPEPKRSHGERWWCTDAARGGPAARRAEVTLEPVRVSSRPRECRIAAEPHRERRAACPHDDRSHAYKGGRRPQPVRPSRRQPFPPHRWRAQGVARAGRQAQSTHSRLRVCGHPSAPCSVATGRGTMIDFTPSGSQWEPLTPGAAATSRPSKRDSPPRRPAQTLLRASVLTLGATAVGVTLARGSGTVVDPGGRSAIPAAGTTDPAPGGSFGKRGGLRFGRGDVPRAGDEGPLGPGSGAEGAGS